MKKIVILIAMLVIIAGCKDKRIDSSSDENLRKSIEAVKKPLSSEKRKEFEEAIQAVSMSEIGNIFGIAANPEGMKRRIKDKLHGKTADEIIAEGNRISQELERANEEADLTYEKFQHDQRERVIVKIAELKKKQAKAEQDKELGRQFAIIQSQFSTRKSSYQGNVHQIELAVKNGTEYAISKVEFQCVFTSPGRSVPWEKGHISHDIPGGLESGEQATWDVGTYHFDDVPEGRDDIVLTVTTSEIYGTDGTPLFDSEFSRWDKAELEELTLELKELKK